MRHCQLIRSEMLPSVTLFREAYWYINMCSVMATLSEAIFQVVVLNSFSYVVLQIAQHDMLTSGDKENLTVYFNIFWPQLKSDVTKSVKSCHVCQIIGKPSQVIKAVPLSPIQANRLRRSELNF